jgi:periplasmic divalent cation tolerance protein
VLVTGPDTDSLATIARVLVGERLATCVNVIPGLRSVFRWGGAIEEANEALAILKTTAPRLPALAARVRELHPYEEPEVIALAAAGGSESYLDWVIGGVEDG